MKKGYKSALSQSDQLKITLKDLDAFSGFIPELLKEIDVTASSRLVTRAELKRDFGYTDSALRLLEKSKQLLPHPMHGARSRPMYDLARALRIRVLQAGILMAQRVKTVRKGVNITTIHREFLNRISDGG